MLNQFRLQYQEA